MPSRSRDRHLAKLAARRQAERAAARRRRNALFGGIAAGVVVLAILGGLFALTRNNETASGSPSPSAPTVACGAAVPKDAGTQKPTFKKAPKPADVLDPGREYSAVIDTSCGPIQVRLLSDQAPHTVASFVYLARKHFFDGLIFHRVAVGIDVIQTGDPQGTGAGGPGYKLPDELTGKEHYGPGTVAMANSGPNTGGSQFFIITGPNGAGLDQNPAYTIFGKVVKGLSVAKKIESFNTGASYDGPPTSPVYMNSVTIKESTAG